jgi:hypothetical protein
MLDESERVENSAETARFSASWDSRVWRAEMLAWRSGKYVRDGGGEKKIHGLEGSRCCLVRAGELEYYPLETSGIRPIETAASFDPLPYLSRLRD